MLTRATTGAPESAAERFRALVEQHVDFVWRSLRRLGVPESEVDDAVQRVWIVAAKRADEIRDETARALFFAIAVRIASEVRRSVRRRREVASDALPEVVDDAALPEEELSRKRARATLDRILDEMPDDLRTVLVLSELEQMTAPEIAHLIGIPLGTVASRLRRAREVFQTAVARRERSAP